MTINILLLLNKLELNLKNKKVLITGSSEGIGRGIANSFLNEESKVFLIARNETKLVSLKKKLDSQYGSNRVFIKSCDCTSLKDLLLLKKEVIKSWKNLDFLVLNVGSGKGSTKNLPPIKKFQSSFSINFLSAYYTLHYFLPLINKSGVVSFISSIAGEEVIGAPTEYSVAKTALISLSKNLSRKTAKNIRFNTIIPGNIFFKNGTWDYKKKENPTEVKKMIKENVPLGRFGKPEEVGNLVVYLSSERASFINGSVIRIDGGQTLKI